MQLFADSSNCSSVLSCEITEIRLGHCLHATDAHSSCFSVSSVPEKRYNSTTGSHVSETCRAAQVSLCDFVSCG